MLRKSARWVARPDGCRSLWGCRDGAVAAEFGLVAPLMIAMLMGTLEYGLIIFSYSSMQTAARDVARQVSVNTISVAAAEDAAKQKVAPWMRDDVNVSISESASGDPATNVITMQLDVPASKAAPVSFFSKAADWTLSTQVEMKQELPFVELEP
jgi:Flp pilus assembly protein TadG